VRVPLPDGREAPVPDGRDAAGDPEAADGDVAEGTDGTRVGSCVVTCGTDGNDGV
jgi:hypothetical protein